MGERTKPTHATRLDEFTAALVREKNSENLENLGREIIETANDEPIQTTQSQKESQLLEEKINDFFGDDRSARTKYRRENRRKEKGEKNGSNEDLTDSVRVFLSGYLKLNSDGNDWIQKAVVFLEQKKWEDVSFKKPKMEILKSWGIATCNLLDNVVDAEGINGSLLNEPGANQVKRLFIR